MNDIYSRAYDAAFEAARSLDQATRLEVAHEVRSWLATGVRAGTAGRTSSSSPAAEAPRAGDAAG